MIKEILIRNRIPPSPKRRQEARWRDFIKDHMHNTAATDFFTVEALTPRALVTYYVLFFLHHASRRVHLAGITKNPDEPWMKQMARNETMEGWGFPKEMSVVGFDDDARAVAYGITTLHRSYAALGRLAADFALRSAEQQYSGCRGRITVEPQLVLRRSSGPPGSAG